MQNLKYGVEIEFLGITREAAAEIVADFFGTGYFYEGGDLKERDIADSDLIVLCRECHEKFHDKLNDKEVR